ncbi:MAG: YlzJ-like family protein [Firmicutes bacterium]|nr:YlzJ-like family protein [Bacillota bacterium]
MIWSIISEEDIFAGQPVDMPALRSVDHLGKRLLIRPGSDGWGEIVSLLSTAPADFLDGRFAPGTRIRL